MKDNDSILHVAGLEKFIPPFVELIQEEFKGEGHQFWLTGSTDKYPVTQGKTVYVCRGGFWHKLNGYIKLVKQLHNANKVILHGLFKMKTVKVLALCPWVLPKCYWVIWGADLYQYQKASKKLRSRFNEAIRRFVIQRLGHLITYIKGDVDLARQWYGAKGVHHECIMYLSNVVHPGLVTGEPPSSDKERLNILLGNSAGSSNNHIEALEHLLSYKDNDIKIYAPLSYGNQKYAKKVINQGKEWFGEKFVAITDFIPLDQYMEFLKTIDIAVFNHQRQQAMGNTITLLAMRKTVFMRSDVSQWRFLCDLGVHLKDVEKLNLEPIGSSEARLNSRIVQKYFSKATLVKQLANIFGG